MEPSSKALNLTISQLKRIVKFYKYIQAQYDQPPEYDTVALDDVPDGKQLSSILFTSEREVHRVLKLSKTLENLKTTSSKVSTRVKFKEDGRTFLDFVSCFEFGTPGFVGLQRDVTHEKKCQIGELFNIILENLFIFRLAGQKYHFSFRRPISKVVFSASGGKKIVYVPRKK